MILILIVTVSPGHLAPTIQVMVNVVEYGVNALPFGAPVAALIGCIYSRAAQVRPTGEAGVANGRCRLRRPLGAEQRVAGRLSSAHQAR